MKLRRSTLLGALIVGGALLTAGVRAPAPPHATMRTQEFIRIDLGDTIALHYSVRADGTLGVGSGVMTGKKCGTTRVYNRIWLRRPASRDSVILSADSVNTAVCPGSAPALPPIVPCMRVDAAAFARLGVNADTTLDPSLVLVPCT